MLVTLFWDTLKKRDLHCFFSLVCATLSLDVRIVLAGDLLPTLLWSPPPSPHSQLGPVWLRATGLSLIKIGKAMTGQLLQVKITLIFFKRPCALCRGWQSTF